MRTAEELREEAKRLIQRADEIEHDKLEPVIEIRLALDNKNPLDQEIMDWIKNSSLSDRRMSVLVRIKLAEYLRGRDSAPAAVIGSPEAVKTFEYGDGKHSESEICAYICNLRAQGVKPDEIARRTGKSISSVYRIFRRNRMTGSSDNPAPQNSQQDTEKNCQDGIEISGGSLPFSPRN